MNLVRANSNQKKMMRHRPTFGLNPDSVLIIKLPDSRILGIISKSLFLAIFILALPSIGSFVKDASLAQQHTANPHDFLLPIVFKDLMVQGLLNDGHKGLLLSSNFGDLFDSFWFLNEKGIDLVIDSDSDRQMVIPDEVFDFVFASSLENTEFINRVVKLDGIVVMPLGKYYDRSYEFLQQSNYKIVYLRQFDSITVIAMRKIDGVLGSVAAEGGGRVSGMVDGTVIGTNGGRSEIFGKVGGTERSGGSVGSQGFGSCGSGKVDIPGKVGRSKRRGVVAMARAVFENEKATRRRKTKSLKRVIFLVWSL
ncbi:hypothetical protein L6452_27935 [Arctium lappa]|uniref:Uncharacterized protein n=1 Tax=Arctium lappa TaxID=4217 RepID=A0ACB8ZX38_ARCLA|nr:hypothetical protein L6452_27935 [Arctium lappa]